MLNPYILLTPALLEAMTRQRIYFIRQQWPRGKGPYEDDSTTCFLFTHYVHHEIDTERVQRHMRLLFNDPYRCLYDSQNPEHMDKLRIAASQPEGYRIYINLMVKKWKATDALKRKISAYVASRLSWWKYNPADKLKVTLKERYGSLYLALLWKGQQTEVHLEEIENFRPCVTT